MDAVTVSGVKKRYREGEHIVHAVDGVDLVLGRVISRPSRGLREGGKTTLLNLIGGLDHPDEGNDLGRRDCPRRPHGR